MLKRNDDGQAAAAFYDMRRKWLDYTCELDELSDRAFRVGHWLAKKMNGQDQCCWYTQRQIAKILRISEDKVIRAIAELVAANVMVVVKEHRKPNVYYIRLPFDAG
jgi:hypothetical protein